MLNSRGSSSLDPDAAVLRVLKQFWGYDSLRPLQAEAIAAGAGNRDSLVVFPTGGGKSLCYQVPPVLSNRTDVVVSPLISLMKDQVDGLRLVGYPAATIHSGLEASEQREVIRAAAQGAYRLLFVSPERILSESSLGLVRTLKVASFSIDEAHCISHWGHDFRQDYRKLGTLKEVFPGCSVHAFTATATPRVRDDIRTQLRLDNPVELVGRFDRSNLVYRVLPKAGLKESVFELLLRHRTEAAIVYCLSRKDTEALASYLRSRGLDASAYHAGLDSAERTRIQEAFAEEALNVVVATVAFGMGIDRSNVRLIVHASMPRSIEQYQQETGRGGRDGLEAECVLFYSYADVVRWERLLEMNEENGKQHLEAQRTLLKDMQSFCQLTACRHRVLSEYFGQAYQENNCGACDVCLGEVDCLPDSNDLARKIISAVYRVGERFGVNYVVEVLRGAESERVVRLGHNRLSVYGLLKDRSEAFVRDLAMQLLDQGVLTRTADEHPVLRLNELSAAVLKGRRTVYFRRPEGWRLETSVAQTMAWAGVDAQLFEYLRGLRKELARQLKVPAYQLFTDVTLRELARFKPDSPAGLRLIRGIGEKKCAAYGSLLLEVISRFRQESDAAAVVDPQRLLPGQGEPDDPHFLGGAKRRLRKPARRRR